MTNEEKLSRVLPRMFRQVKIPEHAKEKLKARLLEKEIRMGNVKDFYDAMAKDEAMRKRAESLNEKFKGKQPSDEEAKKELIAFAKAEGYGFTKEEYKAFAEKPKKMPEDDLKAVAGGGYNDGKCFCMLGGGGKDKSTDQTCACVLAGMGKTDKEGDALYCVAYGSSVWYI
jgi:hypothetical protein